MMGEMTSTSRASVSAAAVAAATPRSASGRRAMVIEDERSLASVVATYLEREGFEVTICGDGTEAVALAREADKLVGLFVGSDDYLSKPFSPRELVAQGASFTIDLPGPGRSLTQRTVGGGAYQTAPGVA